MPAEVEQQPEATAPSAIPRWEADFDISSFDLQAVLREASAQKKSAGELLKSLGYPVAELVGVKTDAAGELKSAGAIPVSASSTAQDLAGDDFAAEALKQMRAAAVGTTVFLNHEYTVPEDVYGKVASAEIITRSALDPLSNQTRNITFLDMSFDPVGEEENPRAVQVTKMLRKSQLRLGVSVTVLVLAYKDRDDGGRTITKVYYLETSIVGIPCNQTAWVRPEEAKSFSPAATATKSLTEMTGTENKSAAITGASAAAGQPTSPTRKSAFWADAQLASKAMFADVLEENRNNYWILSDSFRTVYHRLLREARGKSGESLTTLVNEADASVDEFAAELKQLLADEINEAATQETTSSPYYEWWSAIGRLQGLVQKSGARNSKSDQALLNKAHDCIVEAGGACSHGEAAAAETEGGGEAKQASLGGAETKTAALELKVAELETERDAAVELAETLADELAEEREVSQKALDALDELSREELPRAGA